MSRLLLTVLLLGFPWVGLGAPALSEAAAKDGNSEPVAATSQGDEGAAKPESKEPVGPLKVVVVGDTTAAEASEGQPGEGWGHFLPSHFKKEAVQVTNAARRGVTARGFIEQGAWKEVLRQRPGLVLVQFGQEDSAAQVGKPGDPAPALRDFKKYLGAYVDTGRKAGVQVVLLTPLRRFQFNEVGKPKDDLGPYVEAVRQTAESRSAALVDLYEGTGRLLKTLGPEKAVGLQAKPGEPVAWSRMGASAVASLVAREAGRVDERLTQVGE